MKQRGRKSAASLSVFPKPHIVASAPPSDPPEPPAHLGEPEQQIWREVLRDYRGTNAALAMLASGLESHMRARQCREAIAEDGMTVPGRSVEAAPVACRRARRNARLSANISGARHQGVSVERITPDREKFSATALAAFREMHRLGSKCTCTDDDEECCWACEQWWQAHKTLFYELKLPPWDFPVVFRWRTPSGLAAVSDDKELRKNGQAQAARYHALADACGQKFISE